MRRPSSRGVRLLTLLLSALVLTLYARYLVLPAWRDLAAARRDYRAAVAEFAAAEARLAGAPKAPAARRDELKRLIAALEDALPRDLDGAALATELLSLARGRRVQVRALKFGPVTERSSLAVRGVHLEVAGGPDEVYSFLQALEGYRRPLSIAAVGLGAEGEAVAARIELEFLALPGVSSGGPAGGPPLPPSRAPLRVIRPQEQAGD